MKGKGTLNLVETSLILKTKPSKVVEKLNELKKIASHPINQELQLQNIFIK